MVLNVRWWRPWDERPSLEFLYADERSEAARLSGRSIMAERRRGLIEPSEFECVRASKAEGVRHRTLRPTRFLTPSCVGISGRPFFAARPHYLAR